MDLAERLGTIEAVLADPRTASSGELVDALVAVERLQAELAVRMAAVTAECDRRMLAVDDGFVSTGTWMAKRCDLHRAAAGARVREARSLVHMPETVAAAEAGEISAPKVTLLARARREKLAEEFDRFESQLVEEAKRLSCDDLARLLRRWADMAADAVQDGEPPEPPAERQPTEVHLSQGLSGRWTLSGDLSVEDGAILAQGLQAAGNQLFHKGATAGDGTPFTPAQRRGHALVEVFRRGMTAADDRPGAHPLLLAVVDVERLGQNVVAEPAIVTGAHLLSRVDEVLFAPLELALSGAERAGGSGVDGTACPGVGGDPPERWAGHPTRPDPFADLRPPGTLRLPDEVAASIRRLDDARTSLRREIEDDIDRDTRDSPDAGQPPPWATGRCEIDGAGPVPTAMIQRLACDGALRRVIVDAEGEPLDVGRAERLATPAQRAAVRVRDRGCVFPECDRPPGWCQVHHLDPYEPSGLTNLDNLALVCSHHHHLVHEGRWTIERVDGTWVATSPTGRIVRSD